MRRHFLNLTAGLIAGAAALGSSAQGAPLPPMSAQQSIQVSAGGYVQSAVVSGDEIDRIKPLQMRWGHHGHHGWHHRHWHHRHWGWRHHHWHHRHWHHRHW
jgi:hypothetical protein